MSCKKVLQNNFNLIHVFIWKKYAINIYYIAHFSLLFAMETSELSYCGIKFEVKKNGYSDINYILIHGDEETARMLLNEHIQNYQGRAFFIKSKRKRSSY